MDSPLEPLMVIQSVELSQTNILPVLLSFSYHREEGFQWKSVDTFGPYLVVSVYMIHTGG